MSEIFEWERVLFGELEPGFLLEVAFRTVIMFIVILLALTFTGKRGVKMLSIFEMVIIIALGSAAGDPMFYEDVGLLPAITVFLIIMSLYRLVTWLTGKNKRFEEFIEGKAHRLIKDGNFSVKTFKKEALGQDEFFAELRVRSVEHLGQVRNAYLETNGELSLYFYPDSEVKPGLPVLPELFANKSKTIPAKGLYSCTFCGHTKEQKKGTAKCTVCAKEEWVEAIDTLRIN